jgi:hypothetical protein
MGMGLVHSRVLEAAKLCPSTEVSFLLLCCQPFDEISSFLTGGGPSFVQINLIGSLK